jgi:3-phenylpropionate/cinnamic acid dioxygenase small subunit
MGLDLVLLAEVEQFLYREARLLDEQRFHEWLDLFTDDVRYWVPVRESVLGGPEIALEEDTLALAHFDDDRAMLEQRVRRLDTGLAHSETPASRTRHLISNVEVEGDGDEVVAYSNFLLFQSRREHADYFFLGRREDLLRRVNGAWRIARRKVYLDHAVLPRAISVFF